MTAVLVATVLGSLLGAAAPKSIYDFTMNDIDGKPVKMEKFKNKVILVVNVASKCGNTPQYAALEKLYREQKGNGFVVLGFPANEFGGQEPGSNEDIKQFCTSTHDVTFPMFSKIVVKGKDVNPMYQWLVAQTGNKDIEWNFAKFLIGRDGQVFKRFSPKTQPDSDEFIGALKEVLSK